MGGPHHRTLLALILVISLVPAAEAGHTPPCSDVTESPLVDTGVAYVRLAGDDVQLWQETNGVDGLQVQGCTDGSGSHVGADALHTSQPEDALDLVTDIIRFVIETCNDLFGPGTNCL